MRIIHERSEVYPATTAAGGRCSLCGMLFDFGPMELSFESADGESFGDVCDRCATAAPEELQRRMLQQARMLRGMADELEELAKEPIERPPELWQVLEERKEQRR